MALVVFIGILIVPGSNMSIPTPASPSPPGFGPPHPAANNGPQLTATVFQLFLWGRKQNRAEIESLKNKVVLRGFGSLGGDGGHSEIPPPFG
jgi:hypothetical protein